MKTLQDKVTIVTGAGSGIGRSVALAYAREGAKVIVSDMEEDSGRHTVRLITNEGGESLFVKCDVSSPQDNEAWLSSPKASFVTGAYYPVDGGYLAE